MFFAFHGLVLLSVKRVVVQGDGSRWKDGLIVFVVLSGFLSM